MDIDFSHQKMVNDLKKMVTKFIKSCHVICSDSSDDSCLRCTLTMIIESAIGQVKRLCIHTVAQALCVISRCHHEIWTVLAFFFTDVRNPVEDDWEK